MTLFPSPILLLPKETALFPLPPGFKVMKIVLVASSIFVVLNRLIVVVLNVRVGVFE
jgi:hypothetical protein